ncbi:hypothetical protein SAMN04487973_1191 [Pediococcus ethanolidurans]|uniref:Uncharacterized protein n=1 Tax=Pediococcus ethanolidurans TaxID=319653 RepID=A0A1H9SAF0_9LACO|nr:hypothetical protein SAMN04487973_1191 [Pediococcus ethanolidurans]
MKKIIYSEKFIRFLTLLGPFVIAMDPLDSYSPRNIVDNIIGSLSNRIGGDFERHIHFGECAFCLLMN